MKNPGGGRKAKREGRRKGGRRFLEGRSKGILNVGGAAEEHVVDAAEEELEDAVKGVKDDCCCWWWW